MVNPKLLDQARTIPESRSGTIAVTGGTGFVGSHLARCLAEAGRKIVVLGRNRYRTHRIQHANIRFIKVDICDAEAVASALTDCELVYHCAALSTPWGDRDRIQQVNVGGTQNVVLACERNKDARLIHVSSTSIFFNYEDLHNHHDDDPLPTRHACHYSESKRQAEEVVNEAAQRGLNAFTIRARAVFGEGDTSLLPRLIQTARDGRLRQVGSGKNRVDLTYVDNLVLALILAAERGEPGDACTVTNGQPVVLWHMLPRVLSELDIPYSGKHIPYPVVNTIAKLREVVHAVWPSLGEPKLTRYTAGLLAKYQVFDPSVAAEKLGYHPIVSMEDGLQTTIHSLRHKTESCGQMHVKLSCHTTGYTMGNRRFVERTSKSEQTRFHAFVGLIDHPTHGLTLFDTGYAPRLAKLKDIPGRLYSRLLPVVTNESLSIVSQLRQLGIATDDVKRVIVSHFHPDHIAGLKDFPNAEFIASRTAWQHVQDRRGFRALKQAFLPGLMPDDFEDRLHVIETYHDAGMGPFDKCHDLFGDGSVRCFELPGHAAGQIGALVQSGPDERCFLVADAAWTTAAIRDNIMPHFVTRLFVHSFKDIAATLKRLNEFNQQFPDIQLLPTHCPEVAKQFGFDDHSAFERSLSLN